MKQSEVLIIPVAMFMEDEREQRELLVYDAIRTETLKRLCAIPSYPYKSLAFKNRYYDAIKRKVQSEYIAKYL